MNKYTRLFIDESRLYIPGIAAILDRLRHGCPGELDTREGQRRSHYIKGMALYEQQPAIAALAWAMERGFERLQGDGDGVDLVGGLEAAVPILAGFVDDVEKHGSTLADPTPCVRVIEAALRQSGE